MVIRSLPESYSVQISSVNETSENFHHLDLSENVSFVKKLKVLRFLKISFLLFQGFQRTWS